MTFATARSDGYPQATVVVVANDLIGVYHRRNPKPPSPPKRLFTQPGPRPACRGAMPLISSAAAMHRTPVRSGGNDACVSFSGGETSRSCQVAFAGRPFHLPLDAIASHAKTDCRYPGQSIFKCLANISSVLSGDKRVLHFECKFRRGRPASHNTLKLKKENSGDGGRNRTGVHGFAIR